MYMCVMYICYLRRIWISQHLRFCYLFWTCFSFHCKDKKTKKKGNLNLKEGEKAVYIVHFLLFDLYMSTLVFMAWGGALDAGSPLSFAQRVLGTGAGRQ